MSEDWSREEVELTVQDYLSMLSAELRQQKFVKADHYRALQPKLRDRSPGSIQFKYGNVSAALLDLGMPFVDGYKPYANYQGLVLDVVKEQLEHHPDLIAAIEADVAQPAVVPSFDDILSVLVDRPEPESPRKEERTLRAWFEKPRISTGINYLEREAANYSLGAAGEEFVHRFEVARLVAAGHEPLAAKVERVSRTRGDNAGFDILSFETNGSERLVEVKTTRYGRHTPFFLSRNEVQTSDTYTKQYSLYRLFQFRDEPRLFILPGSVRSTCRLDPAVFEAVVT